MIDKQALYFRQAAQVLGEKEAERHLLIAEETTPCRWNYQGHFARYRDHYLDDDSLLCMFTWSETAQGYDFWSVIHEATLDLEV